ncbi:glycoside hydrolase family 127 protein [Paenibacillus sp. DLE-14]|uniref:Glycoside hydrolase family 127 protein n=1 Tax=Paenibacillus lignilyticus TaxID=1172615 RepID=A0ABS5CE56_9BACL|nr:glycoside hydrolase family 127 protein [Paenibacillus lignilyticus]
MNRVTAVVTPLPRWKSIPFTSVEIKDAFWRPRLEVLKNVTVRTCLDQCEATGRITNFAKAGGLMEGEHEGMYYNDSDLYKVIEGAAYALMLERDPSLEAELDRIIALIHAAQEPDGYLTTYYTLRTEELKWSDMEKHEMYNGGHLIEAAVAYYESTGKRVLLDVACRMVDHYDSLFGPGKRHWVEGHEEIELALVKLYRVTQEERYWKLALWLLEERGHGHGVGVIWDKPDWGPAYCQDDVPVRDIEKVTGHAVRAMYLYTAMADVVHASGDPAYVDALHRVWSHTVERNLYLTGGIGPSVHNEGFTHDYDLPNESAYCETCAAIAMAFWNNRMNLLFGDAKYADLVERELYNGALSGISLSGDTFFYVNPLASKGGHHRVEWFHTSCCPTNLVRFLPSIGQYTYASTNDGIAVNQYMSGDAVISYGEGQQVRLQQTTNYPWQGSIAITVEPEREEEFVIRLRLPDWCRGYSLRIGGEKVLALPVRGYLEVNRKWTAGEVIELVLDMPVELVRARYEVEANRGRVALQRGPIVYCMEEVDNSNLAFDESAITDRDSIYIDHEPELLGGITVLTVSGREAGATPLRFIPYYAWDNRDPGYMQVWIREQETTHLYRY